MNESINVRVNSELIGVFEDLRKEINNELKKIFGSNDVFNIYDNGISKLLSRIYWDSKDKNINGWKKLNVKLKIKKEKKGFYIIEVL